MPPSPSPARQFKDAVYDQLARIGKSLASGPRLEILDILCQGPRTVEVLAAQVGQSVANTSHHLQVLRRARLVDAERDGVHVTYRLTDERVDAFFRSLRDLAESRLLEIAEVTRVFLRARGSMEPVDRDALVDRIRKGAVTVLDVRPAEEYRAGHLPGAVSVPLGELERRLAELPRDREVVAYCRGPYCVMAVEAVELLRSRGFRAIRMEEGVPDWRARGLPVEVVAVEVST
ncbi:MAG: metalloregulator ArsR/SmtB family transcription factor [Deltaproteobacteria bacterium]|nr:metalloregulator ArsR/SmtB family transcription factor [Deltaproteobacteria bacterium]